MVKSIVEMFASSDTYDAVERLSLFAGFSLERESKKHPRARAELDVFAPHGGQMAKSLGRVAEAEVLGGIVAQ
jgi:hypothetical protein